MKLPINQLTHPILKLCLPDRKTKNWLIQAPKETILNLIQDKNLLASNFDPPINPKP